MYARNEKRPRNQAPSRKQETDTRPGVSATIDTALFVDDLHPAQGGFAVDLRESFLRRGIVQVQKLNALARIEWPHRRDTGPTKTARTVIENRDSSHILGARERHITILPPQRAPYRLSKFQVDGGIPPSCFADVLTSKGVREGYLQALT